MLGAMTSTENLKNAKQELIQNRTVSNVSMRKCARRSRAQKIFENASQKSKKHHFKIIYK
jgi:hypothetical protein